MSTQEMSTAVESLAELPAGRQVEAVRRTAARVVEVAGPNGPIHAGPDAWSRLQAARRGDHAAFDDLWLELRDVVRRAVERSMPEQPNRRSQDRVRAIVERVHAAAFDELPEKPDDWSTYGWITWLACREAMDFRTDDRGYESR